MKKYVLVCSEGQNSEAVMESLQSSVNDKIERGYTPVGTIVVCPTFSGVKIVQPMLGGNLTEEEIAKGIIKEILSALTK